MTDTENKSNGISGMVNKFKEMAGGVNDKLEEKLEEISLQKKEKIETTQTVSKQEKKKIKNTVKKNIATEIKLNEGKKYKYISNKNCLVNIFGRFIEIRTGEKYLFTEEVAEKFGENLTKIK